MIIEPIDAGQQRAVHLATERCLRRAGELCGRDFASIPVTFDLTGRSAGMYRVRHGRRSIRYNPYLFAKYFEDNLAVTVPHEVAHYVTDMLYGLHRVRPHGMEWQAVMRSLGVEPRAALLTTKFFAGDAEHAVIWVARDLGIRGALGAEIRF